MNYSKMQSLQFQNDFRDRSLIDSTISDLFASITRETRFSDALKSSQNLQNDCHNYELTDRLILKWETTDLSWSCIPFYKFIMQHSYNESLNYSKMPFLQLQNDFRVISLIRSTISDLFSSIHTLSFEAHFAIWRNHRMFKWRPINRHIVREGHR